MSALSYPGEKRYQNPPIIEVVCDFQFSDPISHSIVNLTKFYQLFQPELPNIQELIRHQLQVASQKSSIKEIRKYSRMIRFYSQDKTDLVQVGDGLFSVNKLKPYQSWKEFKPFILKAHDNYRNVMPDQSLAQIVLRYVNQIDIPETSETVDLSEFITVYTHLPEGMPSITNFSCKVDIPYNEGKERLRIIVTDMPQNEEVVSLLLDLEYILPYPEKDDISELLERAHLEIGTLFERCITDRTRSLFGVVVE